MSWLDALPSLMVALAWLIGPGVLASYAIGLRGIAAWGVAPAVTVATISVAAVALSVLGIPWAPITAGLAVVIPAAVIFLIRLLQRRPFTPSTRADSIRVRLAAGLGLLPAVAIGLLVIVRGFRTPATLSQTYDAVFHYNAIRWIMEAGDAAALSLGSLGPKGGSSFYPAAWHDLASLVALGGAPSVAVAANMASAAIAVVAWPLACVFLSRQLFGPSVGAMAITGVVSVSFAAFPWGLLSFGVLWPNLLGFTLVPIGVGAGLSVLGMTNQDLLGSGRAWLLLVTTVVATGFAHPNTTFSIAAVLLIPACFALVRWMFLRQREGRSARAVLGGATAVVAVVLAWVAVHSLSKVMAVKTFDGWPPKQSISAAVGEALLNATHGDDPRWLLSAAVLAGFFFAFRSRSTAWLPFTHVFLVALFVMSSAVQTSTTHIFTGFWYNDSHRLAAMLPITGVALAVCGITGVASAVRERVAEHDRPRRIALPSSTALAGALGVVLLIYAATWYQVWAVNDIQRHYAASWDSNNTLVDHSERQFYQRVAEIVPDGAVVAGDPWSGTAMLWALTGTRVLYPHLGNSGWSKAQRYLAKHLDEAASNSKVCALTERLNVEYLLTGSSQFWLKHPGNDRYPGMHLSGNHPGFELVASKDQSKLYRITACDSSLATRAPTPEDES